ncbi:MAG: thermonuclease family protein [Nocardioides sp.]|uniref:thermonuclease family protein n=1 Tax=Nocardioides sp. TaxID=35761 RepID=UPI003265BAC3
MRRFVSPLVLIALLAAALAWVAPASAAADMDCGDFATQAAAQSFFLGAGPGDPHRLDADGDGVVCETNACPCIGSGVPVPLVGQPTPTATPTPTSTTNPDGSGNSGPVRRHWGNVVKVTDGDTLKVRLQGVGVRSVRILGIDTPEVYGGRECGGDAASAHMERLAPVGSRVRLESDPSQADRDRYGRWLRYVSRKGADVGREQIRRGLAITYVYRNDPFRRTSAYLRTEKVAHNLLRGSWELCW